MKYKIYKSKFIKPKRIKYQSIKGIEPDYFIFEEFINIKKGE